MNNKIYISGPITGTNDYMKRFGDAEEKFIKLGYSVINPAKVNAQLPKDTTYEEYMRMSIVMLNMCDIIYMLDGWRESCGACLERQLALMLGKTIFHQIEGIVEINHRSVDMPEE